MQQDARSKRGGKRYRSRSLARAAKLGRGSDRSTFRGAGEMPRERNQGGLPACWQAGSLPALPLPSGLHACLLTAFPPYLWRWPFDTPGRRGRRKKRQWRERTHQETKAKAGGEGSDTRTRSRGGRQRAPRGPRATPWATAGIAPPATRDGQAGRQQRETEGNRI